MKPSIVRHIPTIYLVYIITHNHVIVNRNNKSLCNNTKIATRFCIYYRSITKNLLENSRRFFTERVGFEPTKRFWRLRDFQSRAFDHSAISPYRMMSCLLDLTSISQEKRFVKIKKQKNIKKFGTRINLASFRQSA